MFMQGCVGEKEKSKKWEKREQGKKGKRGNSLVDFLHFFPPPLLLFIHSHPCLFRRHPPSHPMSFMSAFGFLTYQPGMTNHSGCFIFPANRSTGFSNTRNESESVSKHSPFSMMDHRLVFEKKKISQSVGDKRDPLEHRLPSCAPCCRLY